MDSVQDLHGRSVWLQLVPEVHWYQSRRQSQDTLVDANGPRGRQAKREFYDLVSSGESADRYGRAKRAFESPCSVYVCEDAPRVLKLQVQRIEMAHDVTHKGQLTWKLFVPEFCYVFPSAIQKLKYFLMQLQKSGQYFSWA